MTNRESNTSAWAARQKVRKLRADQVLAELERAQNNFLESRKRHPGDPEQADKSERRGPGRDRAKAKK